MDMIRIGDVCEVLNGFAFKSENYVESGIRVIRIANVQKGFIEDSAPAFYPSDSEGIDKFMLKEGDLLMSLTGNVGRVAVLAKEFLPAALNQRVACLRMKSDKVLKRYLFHILNSDYFEQQCIRSSKGVAQKNMSTEWLKNYEIPLYSLEEQKEIIKILDNTLKILSERKQQLLIFDTLIKARFVEMFGEPISNSKKLPMRKLGEICELQAGDFTPAESIHELRDENNPYPCYGGNGIRGYVDNYTQEGVFPIIGRQGALCGNVQLASGKFRNTEHAVLVTPRISLNRIWLFELLRLEDLYRFHTGAAQPGLAVKTLNQIAVPVAPEEKQKQYADFYSQIDKAKVVVQKALDKAQLLFAGLMQEYLNY